jgi:hypothetical protein
LYFKPNKDQITEPAIKIENMTTAVINNTIAKIPAAVQFLLPQFGQILLTLEVIYEYPQLQFISFCFSILISKI